MKLKSGLRRDETPSKAVVNSWRDARNKLLSNGFASIENEKGFDYLDIELSYNRIGVITIPNGFIIFSTDNVTTEIGLYLDKNYRPIIRSNYFGHTMTNAIEGVYRYNYKNELIIAWCDGVNTTSNVPYLLNLTDYTLDSGINELSEYELEVVKLFPKFTQVDFNLIDVDAVGGNLESGVYYFAIQYLIDDEDYTNFTRISSPISVTDSAKIKYTTSSVSSYEFDQQDGGSIGNITSKIIILEISNLDTKYSKFRLGVIKKSNGVSTAYTVSTYNILEKKTVRIEHSGNESSILEVTLSDILVNKSYYNKVKTMSINNNKLLLGNVVDSDEIKYQKYANVISANWVLDDPISLDSTIIKGTYKDEITIFTKRGFMAGEVYALYISFLLKDGGYSKAFPIPGRAATATILTEVEFEFGDSTPLEFADSTYIEYLLASGSSSTDLDIMDAAYDTELDDIDNNYDFLNFQILDTSDIITGTAKAITGNITFDGSTTCTVDLTAHGFTEGNYVILVGGTHAGQYRILPNGTDDTFLISSTVATEVTPSVTAQQLYNYGKMGYWQNKNELYPTTEDNDFDSRVDYNGDAIVGGVNLENTEVRHHRFPMLRTLYDNGFHYYTGELDKGNDEVILNFGTPIVENVESTYPSSVLGFENQICEYGTFSKLVVSSNYTSPIGIYPTRNAGNGAKFTATHTITNLVIEYNIIADFNCPYVISPLKDIRGGLFLVTTIGGSIVVVDSDYQTFGVSTDLDLSIDSSITGTLTIPTMNSGDTIEIYGLSNLDDTTLYSNGFFSGSITGTGLSNSEVSGSKFTKPLGLRISNVIIPDVIKDKILGWEIFYAERNFSNSTVVCQGRKIEHDTNKYYMHPFDLFKNNELPTVNPNYLIHESDTTLTLDASGDRDVYESKTANAINIPDFTTISNEAFRATSNIKYLPRDNSISEPSNEFNEMRFYGEARNATQDSDLETVNVLVTLYNFKKNLYYPFTEQKLVSTGRLNLVSTDSPYSINRLYGGDTFSNMYGVRTLFNETLTVSITDYSSTLADTILLTTPTNHGLVDGDTVTIDGTLNYDGTFEIGLVAPTTFYIERSYFNTQSGTVEISSEDYYTIFCQSTANIGFRHEGDLSKQEVYYPKKTKVDNTVLGTAISQKDIPSYFGYNNDYSSLNDKNTLLIDNYKNTFVNQFPFRIAISNTLGSESSSIAFRYFQPLSYFESVRNKGEIWKLFNDGLNLGISHKYSLFIARLKDTLNIGSDVVVSLGDADLFDTLPQEIIINKDGYIGNQSQFATITCKIGTLIIDRQQGKIFIYNDNNITEISNKGLRAWCYNNIQHAVSDGLILATGYYLFADSTYIQFGDNEMVAFTATIDDGLGLFDIDNPFNNRGYTAAWDDENERLIITKRDYTTIDRSFTISYNPNLNQGQGGFVAFHDYKPNFIFSNREGLYSISNLDKIYKHNSKINFTKFYEATPYASYIDVVFNTPEGINKLYNSINWKSVVLDGNIHKFDETFTSIIIFNYNQHSNKIQLIKQDWGTGNVRLTGGTWKFNEFKDLLNNKDFTVIEDLDIDELFEEELDASRIEADWFNKGLFINDFIIVRFIYDNVDQHKLLLSDVNVNTVLKNRI